MKINELKGLYVGYNAQEDFRVLIYACDEKEAQEVADGYAQDIGFDGSFTITEPTDNIANLRFDSDIIISKPYPDNSKMQGLTNLLYNAIMGWYDNSLESYNGLDDEDFISLVCDCTGMNADEYRKVMGIDTNAEYKLCVTYYPFNEPKASLIPAVQQSSSFVSYEQAYDFLKERVESDLASFNRGRKQNPVEDSVGNVVGYDYPFRADYDGKDDCVIRFWDGDDYWVVNRYNIKKVEK